MAPRQCAYHRMTTGGNHRRAACRTGKQRTTQNLARSGRATRRGAREQQAVAAAEVQAEVIVQQRTALVAAEEAVGHERWGLCGERRADRRTKHVCLGGLCRYTEKVVQAADAVEAGRGLQETRAGGVAGVCARHLAVQLELQDAHVLRELVTRSARLVDRLVQGNFVNIQGLFALHLNQRRLNLSNAHAELVQISSFFRLQLADGRVPTLQLTILGAEITALRLHFHQLVAGTVHLRHRSVLRAVGFALDVRRLGELVHHALQLLRLALRLLGALGQLALQGLHLVGQHLAGVAGLVEALVVVCHRASHRTGLARRGDRRGHARRHRDSGRQRWGASVERGVARRELGERTGVGQRRRGGVQSLCTSIGPSAASTERHKWRTRQQRRGRSAVLEDTRVGIGPLVLGRKIAHLVHQRCRHTCFLCKSVFTASGRTSLARRGRRSSISHIHTGGGFRSSRGRRRSVIQSSGTSHRFRRDCGI
mmetsp:Transcript_4663/g.7837  ORF Transcript_4663/g.7837 Transcript_4663/m.7837 type:complete len:481 (-) Transcript_4663:1122-2564(-)